MRTLLVDDNSMDLEVLKLECDAMKEIEVAGCFSDPLEAIAFARTTPIDFVMLDIEMPRMNGLILAEKLRELYPQIIIIFVTAHSQYTLEALRLKADYYVIKPYSSVEIRDAIRRACLLARGNVHRVYIRTFGRFDVFVDGRLVKFTNAKSKELLALCVDHLGGAVSMEEAIDKLWEDKDYDSRAKALYRKAIIYIKNTLNEYGISEIFVHSRGSCHIVTSDIECDYYEYLKDICRAKNSPDDYLFEYSWAEVTNAKLSFGKDYIE